MALESAKKIIIRRCTPADDTTLMALARRTFHDTFVGTCTDSDLQAFLDEFYNLEQLNKELGNEHDFTFFAELDGEAIGYIRFIESVLPFPKNTYQQPLELNRLYIDQPFLGAGIAQQLVDFFVKFAQHHHHDLLWLGVWEFNFRAQSFYRKNNFTFTGYKHPFPIGATPQTDEWWSRPTII